MNAPICDESGRGSWLSSKDSTGQHPGLRDAKHATRYPTQTSKPCVGHEPSCAPQEAEAKLKEMYPQARKVRAGKQGDLSSDW